MALAPVKNRTKSNNTPKQRAIRQLRITVIVVVVLLMLAIGGGLLYVWLMGLQAKPSTTTATTQTTKQPSFLTPHKLPDNVEIGTSIQSLSSPIRPGDNASLSVRTTESAVCVVKIIRLDDYQKELARVTDSGLGDKKADEFGMVTWTWTMPADAAIAKWKADVLCTRGTAASHSVGDIVVQKHA